MPDIISNTSCLIVMDNIGRLGLLRDLYGQILITEEVASEFGKELPKTWINIVPVANKEYIRILAAFVDTGEASTIALSLENSGSVMVLDDRKARRLAGKLKLNFTGLLGVIIKAKVQGIIPEVTTVIGELKRAGFRIAHNVETEVLQLAGEQSA